MTLLTKLFALGKRGEYEPIIKIMEDFYRYCENILGLALTDETRDTLFLFLEIIRMGFISREIQIVKWSINIASKIVYLLNLKEFTVEIYDFFVSKCNYVSVIYS